jgi:hypothetical protein
MSPTNTERSLWAWKALLAYMEYSKTDDDHLLCDLLADLMHWATITKRDFNQSLKQARSHHATEIREEKLRKRGEK